MVTTRVIKEEEIEDPVLNSLSDVAVRIYFKLRLPANKAGIIMNNPILIMSRTIPYHKSIGIQGIKDAISSLVGTGHLYSYKDDGIDLLHIRNWAEIQSPHVNEAKSKYRAPPYCDYNEYKKFFIGKKEHEATYNGKDKSRKKLKFPPEEEVIVKGESGCQPGVQPGSPPGDTGLPNTNNNNDNNKVENDNEGQEKSKTSLSKTAEAAKDGHKESPKGDSPDNPDNPDKDTSLEEEEYEYYDEDEIVFEKGDTVKAIAIIGDSPYLGHVKEVNASKKKALISFFDPVLNPATGKYCHSKTCPFADIEHSDKDIWD